MRRASDAMQTPDIGFRFEPRWGLVANLDGTRENSDGDILGRIGGQEKTEFLIRSLLRIFVKLFLKYQLRMQRLHA